ncbi:MAG: cell division protein ZipA [Halomonadaceae bacterium]|nr:cell division protein ZipA [Halomonadaceae bacterium]
MELREWLIILGLALVTLIVIDGVRRLKRQRRVPRLDQVGDNNNQVEGQRSGNDYDDNWELPNGGARVVKPASYAEVQPKPKLQRQEHPGPSRTLASFQTSQANAEPEPAANTPAPEPIEQVRPEPIEQVRPAEQTRPVKQETQPVTAQSAERVQAQHADASSAVTEQAEPVVGQAAPEPLSERLEPTLSTLDKTPLEPEATPAMAAVEALSADPGDHDPHYDDDERYRLVDLEGMSDSIKDRSRRMGVSVQRFGATMRQRLAERSERKHEEKLERERQRAEKAALEVERKRLEAEAQAARESERRRLEAEAIELADDDDPLFAPSRPRATEREQKSTLAPSEPIVATQSEADDVAETVNADVVRAHPTLARALRHNVCAERARETLSQADEVIVISVLSRDEEGFSGEALLDLMLACGLRYSSDMGIFHRFETEDDASDLQFSMVNALKPGTFPIEAMDEFRTPGITLLMPLPGAVDTAAAFEAMFETAMVIVRNLGGELKDENQSVMTAQTVEFARQRVQEFERLNRLNRYQAN